MAELQFYNKPLLLDTTQHIQLKLKVPFPDLFFTEKASSVPIIGVEFYEICKIYPIVFLEAGDKSFFPVALLGTDVNLFLTPEGMWDAPYLPAFVRRYPFVPAEVAEDGRFSICIDADCPGFDDADGERLFGDDGQPAPLLANAIEFMGQFHQGMVLTTEFCGILKEEGLLREMTSELTTVNGTKCTLRGFFAIDDEKFSEIPAELLVRLRDRGFLPWIYLHLVSMSNLGGIANRLAVYEKRKTGQ